MRFVPDHTLRMLSEQDYENAVTTVEATLDELRETGRFTARDGASLYYEYFLAEDSVASVVLVHGLSEFTRKFYELIHYLLSHGMNVFTYDQRCHGLSDRLTDHHDMLHVDRFDDYVEDLALFVDTVVRPVTDKPLYLYTHSMGGATGALFLAQYPAVFEKAVFTAPMFEPIVNQVPVPIARVGVWVGRLLCGKKEKFPLSREFNPEVKYHPSQGTSRARFEHHIAMRRDNPDYQSTPMSYGWVWGSLTVGRRILRRRAAAKIKTPILILSAGDDTVVNNRPQHVFAARVDSCRLVTIDGATHGMLASDNETLERILRLILDHYSA